MGFFEKIIPFILAIMILSVFFMGFLLESGEGISQNAYKAKSDIKLITAAEQKYYKQNKVYTNRYSDLKRMFPEKIKSADQNIDTIEDGLFLSKDGQELKILIYPLKKGQLSTRLISGSVVERICSLDIPFCKNYYWE